MAAITDAYATAAQYRSAIAKDDTSEDTDVLTDLTTISRYVDTRMGRFFTKDAAAVNRDFYVQVDYRPTVRGQIWHLNTDVVSITSLKTDDNDDNTAEATWVQNTDFVLWPVNAALGPEQEPFRSIYVPYALSSSLCLVTGRLARINGIFGWPAVPTPIQRATIHLTAILRLETPRAERQVSAIGEILGASSQAQGIIYDLIQNYGVVTV